MFEHVQFVFYDSVLKVSAQNGYCHYLNQYLLAVVQQCTHSRSLMETKHKVNGSGFTSVLFYSQSTQSGFTKSHIHAALYSMHQALSNNNAMPWMGPGRFSMLAEHNADYGNQRASVWYTPQGRAHGIHSMCLVPRMLCRAAPNLNPIFTNDFQRADPRYFPLSAACDRGQL